MLGIKMLSQLLKFLFNKKNHRKLTKDTRKAVKESGNVK